MIKVHLLNEQQKAKLQKFTKENNINIEAEEEKTKPINIPEGSEQVIKRMRRSKEEMAEYRRAREERILKKAELKKADNEFKLQKKKRKENLLTSPYRKFSKEFSIANKGKLGKNYAKELSKAWKNHKSK